MSEHHSRLQKVLGFLTQDGKNPHLLAEAADLSLELGDWDCAKDVVARLLAEQPDNPVARYQMALVFLQEREATASLALTQALLEQGHGEPALRFAHARGLVLAGRYADAEPVLAAMLPEADDFPLLPHLYMRTLHFLGRTGEAIAFIAPYIDSHPGDALAQGMASLLYLDHDDITLAAEWSAKALRRSPDNIDALLAAGSVALAYEQVDQARGHFDHALALYGDNGRAWVGIGLLDMREAKLSKAEEALSKAVACMPTHLGTQNALAWAQILQKDYAGAKRTLHASLDVDHNFGETHGALAVVAALEGDWSEARKLSDTAVRLQPQSFAGRYAQSLILAQRGRPDSGQALVDTMLKNMQMPDGGTLFDALQRSALRR